MQIIYLKCECDDYQEFMGMRRYSHRLRCFLVATTVLIFTGQLVFLIERFAFNSAYEFGSFP